jgi:small ligand-binding sensory domain FIST
MRSACSLAAAVMAVCAAVGFFAAGEIAHRQLYGYTGVLTVFCA